MENSTASLAPEEMKIVHAIGGRIRLRYLSGAAAPAKRDRAREFLPKIAQDLREQAGISKVKINETTGSLLVEFDPHNFSQKQLTQLLQPFGVALLSPTKTNISTNSSSSPSQSRVYEQLLSLVPPLLGLAIVRGIGVTGWKSLLTYLVATGVIREIWEQLIPAASSQLSSASTSAVLGKPELNVADESENSNFPEAENNITSKQEQESFSTDDESPSGQEKPLESGKIFHAVNDAAIDG